MQYNPKYWGRQFWANSVDPDQMPHNDALMMHSSLETYHQEVTGSCSNSKISMVISCGHIGVSIFRVNRYVTSPSNLL